MQLTYDNVALHDLGEISVAQRKEFVGGENPYAIRVEMTVTLQFWERTFADNYDLVRQARAALDVQHGQLVWTDSDTANVWVNTPAVVSMLDWPADPNGWGQYEQKVVITFQFTENTITNGSAVATLTFPGGARIDLPQLNVWREAYAAERFDTLHSQRRQAVVRLTASGVALTDGKQTPANRRAALQTLREDWKTKVNAAKECTLTFGAFTKTVRIESLEMEADQAGHQMNWALTAYHTVHPDEANYSIAEYSFGEKNGIELGACGNGEILYTLSGKVQAHSETAAKTRINAIRAAVIDATTQITDTDAESRTVSGLDGTVFVERTFRITTRGWRSDNVEVTFEKSVDGTLISLGKVSGFSQRYSAQRFSGLRSQRQQATGQITIRGTIFTETQDPGGVTQREQLIGLHQTLVAQMNGADGELSYGGIFSKVVRVDDFSADLNNAINGIDWTLTASYSEFPNETNYATVEYTAQTRTSEEDGETLLSFSGRVQATTLAAANRKLDDVRTAVLAQYGFTPGQRLANQQGAGSVSANGDRTDQISEDEGVDGTTFLEVNFSEDYRKRASDVLTYTLRVADSEEVRAGLIATTYSGTVTASGATVGAAYARALAVADDLGGNKYPFVTRISISYDQRKATTQGDAEFVRLEFSYEYQRKGTRLYIEMSASVATPTFEQDLEMVSGYVVAADEASARAAYATIRAGYASRLVMAEETGVGTQSLGPTVSQFIRLDFRMEIFKAKASGVVSIRYEIDTTKEWTTLTQTVTVQGVCIASDRGAALTAVDGFIGALGLAGRQSVRSQRTESLGKDASGTTFFQLTFGEVYSTELTGVSGILECSVTAEVQYSGTRWVVQDVPRNAGGTGGVSIVQDCGLDPGRRTVRGNVVAATAAVATAWATAQKAILTGDANGGSYPLPEQVTTDYEFAPRLEGVVSGASANVKMVRVTFNFGEILPNYPYA